MRTYISALCFFIALPVYAATPISANVPVSATADAVAAKYGKLPLSFEANHGQANSVVRFLSRGNGYSLFLTDTGAVLSLGQEEACKVATETPSAHPLPAAKPCAGGSQKKHDIVSMTLAGAATRPSGSEIPAIGEEELPGKVNYFLGNDPKQWHANLPTYARVRYNSVYPGIDLVYYGNQSQLEYDFIVAPGANPAPIRMNFSGEKRLRLTPNGDLILQGANGSATFHKPFIYQGDKANPQSVPGSFYLTAQHSVGFKIGQYDHTRPLIIDPVLVYSTFLGGSGKVVYSGTTVSGIYGDKGNGIAVDATGHAYVVGTTSSTDFPLTVRPYQSQNLALPSLGTVFVSKFNAAGSALLYSTFLGGSTGDLGNAIAVDAAGNAYITGTSLSSDFPTTTGAFQKVNKSAANGQGNVFVAKLNSNGSALIYSTLLGGTHTSQCDNYLLPYGESGNSIALDTQGNAYVTGSTISPDFPVTPGAFQTQRPTTNIAATNAFVTKVNATGTALLYSTYLGGSGSSTSCYIKGELASAIAVNSSGEAYVAGGTSSPDFPVTNGAYKTVNNGGNAFLTKLNSDGSAAVFSTFFGGSGTNTSNGRAGDYASALVLGEDGSIYLAGGAISGDFPVTAGALYTESPSPIVAYLDTGFVAKLSPTATSLDYSTFLGNSARGIVGLAVDAVGSVYVLANTLGASTSDAIVPFNPEYDNLRVAYIAKLNPTGSAIQFSSQLSAIGPVINGVSNYSNGSSIALDASGNVYATGWVFGTSFLTTPGAYQRSNRSSGVADAFVSKLSLNDATTDHNPTVVTITGPAPLINQGQPATLTAKVANIATGSTPTGPVTFYGGADPYRGLTAFPTTTVNLNSSGTAVLTTTTLSPGLYNVRPSYPGDATHLSSSLSSTANDVPVAFRVIGPPALLTGRSHNPTDGPFVYGKGFYAVDATVTDSAGYGLGGVKIVFSGAGFTVAYPYGLTTLSYGYNYVQLTPTTVGNLVATASVAGVTQTVTYPFTIVPAPLAISVYPSAAVRRYGAANPALTYTISGLVNGETVTVTPTTTATATSPVGSYPLTATVSGASAPHYTATIHSGSLTVVKAPLTLSAVNYQSTYGQTPPQPTAYKFTGFVNGETSSVISGAPVLSANVTAATPVGYYPIKIALGSLSAVNYSIAIASSSGTLQVTKAPLSVKANNQTMHVGGPIPTLTYSFTGFVNGDTAASSVTGSPTLSTTATTHSNPGTYPIYISTTSLASSNYHITGVVGVLTIIP